jgi:conjugal transfer pilus assembly protein TraK
MKKIIAISVMIFTLGAQAIQSFDVKNGSEIKGVIYKTGLSRIYLADDRISAIKGMGGQFQIDKNDEIGDIYIKPLASRFSDEIDLFIQTERGNTYSLRLTASADKPETIRLSANDLIEKKQDNVIGQFNDRRAEVIELIKLVSTGAEIKGYLTQIYPEPSRLKLKGDVASVLEKSYEGKKYRIEVLRIENNTNNRVGVDERDLSNIQNVVAVSLEKGTINSDEATKAYRVVAL